MIFSEGNPNSSQAEFRYGSFRRSVMLPQGIEGDQVEAHYHNGVLEIHLPKAEEAKGKRIPVKAR